MELPLYHLDAFTSRRFGGNPAGVVILTDWLPDAVLQSIAAENNLAETAFLVPGGKEFALRWFSPTMEIDLCGHATLASASVLFSTRQARGEEIVFRYKAGTLTVTRQGDLLAMDFPSRPPEPARADPALAAALGKAPQEVFRSRDLMAVYETREEVASLRPDFAAIERLNTFAVVATAPGGDCDFVSRFFAPKAGVPEDPATGSSHCSLIPFWSGRLGKKSLRALQISPRVGEFLCEDRGTRVTIAGRVVEYLRGTITVDPR
jgi:PhzF family phenazine biosynthesis protein